MRREILVSVLAGCTQFYDLEPTATVDYEPPGCPDERFGALAPLGDFVGGYDEYDPQLGADGNEVWFITIQNQFTLYHGVRSDASAAFTVSPFSFGTIQRVQDPSLTADGRRLMFLNHNGADTDVFEAVRATATTDVFDSVRLVTGLMRFQTGVDALDLSWDGLRIYYTNDQGDLYFADRATRDDSFGPSQRLAADTAIRYPSVSPDELEIFYTHAETPPTIYYRRRMSRGEAFGAEQVLLADAGDPDVTASSRALVVSKNTGLYVLERACPAK